MTAVPTVLRVTGSDAIREAESFVLDNQLFPLGGEARGFLAPEYDIADVSDALGNSVERIEPTYTDLFNYYVHVEASHD
jgi:ABC-2 type transport system ATP-binding protein